MKFYLPLSVLIGFWPACAQTQSLPQVPIVPSAASTSMEPAAQALLDRALDTYQNASGLHFRTINMVGGQEDITTRIDYAGPRKLVAEASYNHNTFRLLLNNDEFYTITNASSYRKDNSPLGGSTELMGNLGSTGSGMIASMLDGRNPLEDILSQRAKFPFVGLKSKTVALTPREIDGDVLGGVQSDFSFSEKSRDGAKHTYRTQVTAWFGGSPFALQRVQRRDTVDGKTITVNEKVFDQELNPTFADDTFQFKEAGLKLAPQDEGGSEVYWDPRLKVGTTPFAFIATGLDGKPLSLANYKSKVVLMDFWATWCGPCVASLPELQSAYDKYHAQGLEVIGISLDADKSALTSFIKARKMPWPQIFDGKVRKSAVSGIYGVKAIPFMLIVGKDGKIAAVNPRGKIDDAIKAALAAK